MDRIKTKFIVFFLSSLFVLPSIYGKLILKCDKEDLVLFQGEKIELKITAESKLPYSVSSRNRFYFSYHIYDMNGGKVSYDNKRFIIPVKIKKLRKTEFKIHVYFNIKESENYKIKLDIVKEGETYTGTLPQASPVTQIYVQTNLIGTRRYFLESLAC